MPAPNNKMMETVFELFYSPPCEEFRHIVSERLTKVYGDVVVKDRGLLPVYEGGWDQMRRQFDAYILLDHLIRNMSKDCALWLVDRDMYCESVNFVFGLAMYNIAAVVSIFRLDSIEMVAKESVHEAGHVLGLRHCHNDCVMRFSNTIDDALRKPSTLCLKCKDILKRKVVEQRAPI